MRMTIHRLLEKMVPDARRCAEAAEALRAKYPHDTPEQLAERAVWTARQGAVTVGALTGAASNPITMIPAALADMAAMLRLEGVMAGTIAALLDPQALDDGSLESDVVTVLFPGAVSQVLRQVGVRAGEQASKTFVRKHLTEGMIQAILKIATRHLGFEITRNAIVEKTVPLVGAGIGAGWNWLEVGAVGTRAIRYYKGEPITAPGKAFAQRAARGLEDAAGRARSAVKRITAKVRSKAGRGAIAALPAPGESESA